MNKLLHRVFCVDEPFEKAIMKTQKRCVWAGSGDLMRAYHDQEWGAPERDGRALWEKLMLDDFQAGLSFE
jgi:DNA-3-methyladenine glycosylase I